MNQGTAAIVERGVMHAGEPAAPALRSGEERTVDCWLDLEQTGDSFHAYCDLDGVIVGPGDEVLIHDAPVRLKFGDKTVLQRRATVRRAGAWQRLRAHIDGYLELTELFEVSFSEGRAP